MYQRLAFLVIPVLLAAACSSARPASVPATVSTPAATATIAPSPTATLVAATSTGEPAATAAPLRQLPNGLCCRGSELPAGTYGLPPRLGPDLSIDVPSGWRIIREDVVNVLALVRGRNSLGDVSEWVAFFALGDDEPVDQFQEDILAMETFDALGEPTEVTMAGYDGWRVDLQALPNPGYAGNPALGIPPESQAVAPIQDYFVSGFNWTTSTPEALVTILALDVDGRWLVAYLEAPDADADAAMDEALDLLASLAPAS